jgi:hypothetical protein
MPLPVRADLETQIPSGFLIFPRKENLLRNNLNNYLVFYGGIASPFLPN